MKADDEPRENFEKIVSKKGLVYLSNNQLYVTSTHKNAVVYLKCFNKHCQGTASIIKGHLTENVYF